VAERTRGRRAGLTRERIIAAAVDLVDRRGLASFGVRPLAAALDVDPMSIYNHVPGKAALLDGVSEAVLTEAAAAAPEPPDEWEGMVRWIASTYREMAMRHPRVFPLLATRAQRSPVALSTLELLAAAMRRAGFADQTIADAPMILFGFLNGYLLAVLGDPDEPRGDQAEPEPARYPILAALAPIHRDFGTEEQFDRMLEVVLDGIRQQGSRGPEVH
jgi:AcrR family transcriptional regulator